MECRSRRRSRFRRRLCVAVAIFLVAAVLLLSYMNAEADAILVEVASRQLICLMTQIVNEAVATVAVLPHYATAEFVHFRTDADGKITSYSTNTALINEMRAEITSQIAEALSALAEYPVAVSYENIFNDVFLFSLLPRPSIHIIVEPFGSVESSVESHFAGAGINQTNHIVELSVTTGVTALLIDAVTKVETTTNVCIAETVVVGEVPNVWLGEARS